MIKNHIVYEQGIKKRYVRIDEKVKNKIGNKIPMSNFKKLFRLKYIILVKNKEEKQLNNEEH